MLYEIKNIIFKSWNVFSCSYSLCPFRNLDVTIELKDPHYPNHDLGSLDLTVKLIPKEGDFRETVSISFSYLYVFLADVFRLRI